MPHYQMTTEGASDVIEAGSLRAAKSATRGWLTEGWNSTDKSFRVRGYVVELDDMNEPMGDQHEVTVTIDPDEPDCANGRNHEWSSPYDAVGGIEENPGVQGHGGGVIVQTVCLVCGCGRTVDTWDTDMSTGGNFTSTAYEADKYEDYIRARLAACDVLAVQLGTEAAKQANDEDPSEWTGPILPADKDAIRELRGCEPLTSEWSDLKEVYAEAYRCAREGCEDE